MIYSDRTDGLSGTLAALIVLTLCVDARAEGCGLKDLFFGKVEIQIGHPTVGLDYETGFIIGQDTNAERASPYFAGKILGNDAGARKGRIKADYEF